MNNADSRVEFIDTAFKRRFNYVYMDEEGLLYCSNEIPGSKQYIDCLINNEENMEYKNLIEAFNKTINRENYHKIRKYINCKLRNHNISEDKLISKYFLNITNNGISVFDFVVKICGYLMQNVLRNNINLTRELFDDTYITIPIIFNKLQYIINNQSSNNKDENIENKNNLLTMLITHI